VNVMPLNTMTALSIGKGVALGSAEELDAALRHIGATRYHSLHPFHRLLHGGKLSKGQVQAWALNRYYYQSTIPIKDAVVISRFRDHATRVEWRHRIEDHDGDIGSEGGIEEPAGGDRLLADRVVCAEPARRAHLGHAAALRFRQS
jgi:pyrroloquinoline-quinone synthase